MTNVDLPVELREPLRPSAAHIIGTRLAKNYKQQDQSELSNRLKVKQEEMNMKRIQKYEEELKIKLRSHHEENSLKRGIRKLPKKQPERKKIGSDVGHEQKQTLAESYLQTYRDSAGNNTFREQQDFVDASIVIQEYQDILKRKMSRVRQNGKKSVKSRIIRRNSLHSRPTKTEIGTKKGKENSNSYVSKRQQRSRVGQIQEKRDSKVSKKSKKVLKEAELNETAYFTIKADHPGTMKSLSPAADLSISNLNKSQMTISKNEQAERQSQARKSTIRTTRKGKSRQVSFLSQMKEKGSFGDSVEGRAMRKISARIGLSGVVYSDQGMRFARWPQEHMGQTYAIEQRLRKQVKDRINNTPQIMRKHSFVVSSH